MLKGSLIEISKNDRSTFFKYSLLQADLLNTPRENFVTISTDDTKLALEVRRVLSSFTRFDKTIIQDIGIFNKNNNDPNQKVETGIFHIHIGAEDIFGATDLAQMNKIIKIDNKLHEEYLQNMISIGHQRHIKSTIPITDNDDYYNISKTMSLGTLRRSTHIAEPIVRNASACILCTRALRKSAIPTESQSLPTGLYPEEACQLMRYIGEGVEMKYLHIKHGESNDISQATLIALLTWYAIEGLTFRDPYTPLLNKELFDKYLVENPNGDINIHFYKNKTTEKWWAHIEGNEKYIPCSYEEYSSAVKGELSTNLLLLL